MGRRPSLEANPRCRFDTVDFDKLDMALHEKGRLAILTLLASRNRWPFQGLKTQLGMSDGNLVTHLRTLLSAGYVSMTTEVKQRPLTTYALTDQGRKAFKNHLNLLEQIIQTARQ
jgi:DNA-binding HxlR family transcriptional regulator